MTAASDTRRQPSFRGRKAESEFTSDRPGGTGPSYKCILADPPWDIEQKGKRGAGIHYPLMDLAAIKGMPVGELAAEDAHLWLWVTNATLRHGYDVAEAWGFTVRSPLTWVKFRLGLGNYLRNSTEHLLFATRGRAPVQYRAQPTWIQAPVQDHSHKPEEQYALIERISPGPYLELFARRHPPHTPGRARWHVWGNEVESDVVVAGYGVPSDNPARRYGQTRIVP